MLAMKTKTGDSVCASEEEEKDDGGFDDVSPTGSSAFAGHYDRLGCEPHIYEVSSLAYRGLVRERTHQTILVSGVSGSGKTESIKIVLNHLASIQQRGTAATATAQEGNSMLVEHLLANTPILEAFGNAKTFKNNNSSRFAKVSKLHFIVDEQSRDTTLIGSSFECYLLEKSRVVFHSNGERNFHIFYQLLAAPRDVKEELMGLDWVDASAEDFTYLSNSGTCRIAGMSDSRLWFATASALKLFGWEGESLETLVQALGIVLLIGNLRFREDTEGEATISSRADLNMLALSLGLAVEDIELALTYRTIRTAQDRLCVPHTSAQARKASDALARAVYSGIVSSVVRQINSVTSTSAAVNGQCLHISLVDMFGFESFEKNQFEQLLVNFANERLQRKYIQDNLHRFKAEYEAEGIEVPDWKDVDNSSTVDLFLGSSGLIKTLNEQCIRPNGSSEVG
jgi:myosin V